MEDEEDAGDETEASVLSRLLEFAASAVAEPLAAGKKHKWKRVKSDELKKQLAQRTC